ncbi:serine hydrolase domain-containing protein [Agrobacterium vitis]|uniref:serine hydrolase domain-containing protein n=1 Tax=Agrobacterium vitis TaxID=373 RepID=UPI001F1DFA1A|nr:serine hydrolase [Agrobacterium vitis]
MSMSADKKAHLMRWYDGTLLPDELLDIMIRDQHWFPSQRIARGQRERSFRLRAGGLPPLRIVDQDRHFDLYDYMSANAIAGLMVLKDGEVAFETYQRGLSTDTPWHSCSLAKSIASTLVGVAIKDGKIGSVDDPISRYVDIGGVYEHVTIRQLLRMNSGVRWNEDYGDPTSERRRLLDIQTRCEAGGICDFMARLPAAAAPGKAWVYNTGESYLVSAVVEAATGMRLWEYLSSRLWSRLGMTHDATWWTESDGGMTISGSGMNATLGDYARFGQFMLEEGRVGSAEFLPAGWVKDAGSPFHIEGRRVPYGYMWWIPELDDPMLQGSFQAEGIYGQYIHINPAHRIVAVVASARSKPSYRKRLEINDDAFFAAVARALATRP